MEDTLKGCIIFIACILIYCAIFGTTKANVEYPQSAANCVAVSTLGDYHVNVGCIQKLHEM